MARNAAPPTPALAVESVVLRPRAADDMAGLLDLFAATQAATGYPVDPLPALATGPAMAHFVGGAPALEVAAMVAWRGGGSCSTSPPYSCHSSSSLGNDHERPEILGHASLRRVPADAAEARAWRQVHRGGEAEAAGEPEPETDPEELWALTRLAVHPAAQGRGLGGRLLAWAEESAHGRRHCRLVLGVLEKDVGAIAVYERRGWRRYGQDAMVGRDGRWWVEYFYVFGGEEKGQ